MRSLFLSRLPESWGWMLVPTYKVLLIFSLLLGCWWIARRLKAQGWDENRALNTLLLAVAGIVLGAKLLYLLQFGPQVLLTSGAFAEILQGGYGLLGGLLGGCLLAYGYLRWNRLSAAGFAHVCIPPMALGLTITRIGCFLRGCNFGTVTDLPWAVRFPSGSPAFDKHISVSLLPPGADRSLPVHPTQLYEAALGLILLVIALKLAPRWSNSGFTQMVMIYAAARFALEYMRDDSGGVAFGPFTFAQGITLLILAGGAFHTWYYRSPGNSMEAQSVVRTR